MAVTVTPDPRPAKRIRDKSAFTAFHKSARSDQCVSCGHGRFIHAHHILSRAQGGDDVLANLVGLCSDCHATLHSGTPYRAYGVRIDANHVRQALVAYIRSEAGDDARWYLTGKLGAEGSVAFLERLEGNT